MSDIGRLRNEAHSTVQKPRLLFADLKKSGLHLLGSDDPFLEMILQMVNSHDDRTFCLFRFCTRG